MPERGARIGEYRRFHPRTSAAARAQQRSSIPSGRTTYRRLTDYTSDLLALAGADPELVKLINLQHPTWEERVVQGVEITSNPNARDGKPVLVVLGVEHGRD